MLITIESTPAQWDILDSLCAQSMSQKQLREDTGRDSSGIYRALAALITKGYVRNISERTPYLYAATPAGRRAIGEDET